MTLSDSWDRFRTGVVTAVAQLMRVEFVDADVESEGRPVNPFAEPTQARLIRGTLDACLGSLWCVAVVDFGAALQMSRVLTSYLMSTMDVPLAAVAFELSQLFPDIIDGPIDVTTFLGADIFGREPEEGEVSIREELHSFIAESLDEDPDGALQVVRTFYDRWSGDEEAAAERCAELVAYLLATLAHRTATDAILEGVGDTG